jgi:hypothetical protein
MSQKSELSLDRSSIIVRVGRMLQRLPLFLLRPLEWPVVSMVNLKKKNPSLIILLALPRSGSTLTYQILSHGLDSVYLSNLGNLLYQLPFFGGLLSKHHCAYSESTFRSSQGFVQGLCGPAEGLRFWQYWYANDIDERKIAHKSSLWSARRESYLRKVFACLGSEDRPVVTGYLGHALKWQLLRNTFPEAVFIRLHRDPVHNAFSLLRCRQKSGSNWFSVYPVECEGYAQESIYGQVAAQVYWLNKRLNEVQGDYLMDISYEDLCRNPTETLQSIISFCNSRGMRLQPRQVLPDSFHPGQPDEDSMDDMNLLKAHLGELEARYGAFK